MALEAVSGDDNKSERGDANFPPPPDEHDADLPGTGANVTRSDPDIASFGLNKLPGPGGVKCVCHAPI